MSGWQSWLSSGCLPPSARSDRRALEPVDSARPGNRAFEGSQERP
jgi:hypothetical protein